MAKKKQDWCHKRQNTKICHKLINLITFLPTNGGIWALHAEIEMTINIQGHIMPVIQYLF